MFRLVGSSLLALAVCAGGLAPEEIEGKLKSVNAAKNEITLTVKEKDRQFTITDETQIIVHHEKGARRVTPFMVPMIMANVTGQVLELHRTGKLRLLAVSSPTRLIAVLGSDESWQHTTFTCSDDAGLSWATC